MKIPDKLVLPVAKRWKIKRIQQTTKQISNDDAPYLRSNSLKQWKCLLNKSNGKLTMGVGDSKESHPSHALRQKDGPNKGSDQNERKRATQKVRDRGALHCFRLKRASDGIFGLFPTLNRLNIWCGAACTCYFQASSTRCWLSFAEMNSKNYQFSLRKMWHSHFTLWESRACCNILRTKLYRSFISLGSQLHELTRLHKRNDKLKCKYCILPYLSRHCKLSIQCLNSDCIKLVQSLATWLWSCHTEENEIAICLWL